MSISDDHELQGMQAAGAVVREALDAMTAAVAPGVTNLEDRHERTTLHRGLVLALEPMISAGSGRVVTRADGVTLGTPDGSLTAHVEHTVVVQRRAPLVLAA